MSRTKLRILFLEFEYEVLCRLQAESEAVMGLINKEKVLRGALKVVVKILSENSEQHP